MTKAEFADPPSNFERRWQDAERRFNLMLQEREFFATQIRDISAAFFDPNTDVAGCMGKIGVILERENPVP